MSCTKLNLFLVAWGTVEVLLFAGIIFGWASLVYIYKQEGFFNYVCEDNPDPDPDLLPVIAGTSNITSGIAYDIVTTDSSLVTTLSQNSNANVSAVRTRHVTCGQQDVTFNLIYTLAVVINGVSTFLNGALWDKFGTTFMRVIGMITFVPGLLLAAFASNESPHLLYPATILIAYGGYAVLMTNFQLANLIPKFRSTIISLYCGAYDSSAFVLIFVKWGYDAGMPVRYVFFAMVAVYSMVVISTFWYMPKSRIPFPLPPGYRINLSCRNPNKSVKYETQTLELSEGESAMSRAAQSKARLQDGKPEETKAMVKPAPQAPPEQLPFLKEMLTAMFILDMVWLTLMRLQSWSFIGRLNPALHRLSGGDKDVVSHYTSVYASMQFFGVFLAPLSGLLMDRKKGENCPPQLKRIELIEVCIASFVIDNTAGLLLAITMTIPVLEVQYLSFVFSVLHRALLYGPNSAFIAQAFSAANFGKLFGLAMTVSAAVSLIQYPLFILQEKALHGNPLYFNLVMLVLMVVAYIHPLYIWRWCRVKRREFAKTQTNSNHLHS